MSEKHSFFKNKSEPWDFVVGSTTSLTYIICHKIRRETLGTVAHGCVVVGVPSENQHGAMNDHSRMQVAGNFAILKDCPVGTEDRENMALVVTGSPLYDGESLGNQGLFCNESLIYYT